jgi:alkylation response protein AidB-like acyl-CoA dehydrogenase
MDFAFDGDQEALKQLASKALAAPKSDAWTELGRAGLLGTTIPAELGGAGLGLIELGLVLQQAGRAAAPLELVPAIVGSAALARFGSAEQSARLTRVLDGAEAVTLALHETGGEPEKPATRAEPDKSGGGFRLHGVKIAVAALERSPSVIVSARHRGSPALYLVASDDPGVRREACRATDDSRVDQLTLDDAHGELLGGGAGALEWTIARLTLAFCAFELGVAEKQLEMTAEHCLRRQQFGKPIGLFQAVGQRAADMHVDVESMRLAIWSAFYRVDSGAEGAAAAVNVAAFWAADAGARVAAAAQHLHAGIGFDRNYPLYRYFLLAKHIELELGGAHRQLARLGYAMAEQSR